MLELHYPTPTKTILKRQYPGKPTLKVAFGNIWQRRHFRKILEVARFSFRGVTIAKIIGTNKLPSSPPPNLRSGSIFVSLRKLHSGGQGETKR